MTECRPMNPRILVRGSGLGSEPAGTDLPRVSEGTVSRPLSSRTHGIPGRTFIRSAEVTPHEVSGPRPSGQDRVPGRIPELPPFRETRAAIRRNPPRAEGRCP